MELVIRLTIEHQCPQCGAPATLEETDRLFTCEFCRVKSFLQERGYFRYMLPSKAPKNRDLIYIPYWRFKGMLFSCLPQEIRHKIVDVSQKAIDSDLFPVSVGLRSQALKLKFVTPESQGFFLKPTLPFADVLESFDRRFNASLPGPIIHQAHIGDSLSIIYSPFHIDRKIYDSVLNKPVTAELPDDFDLSGFPEWRHDRDIKFLSTLCPHCGWDLDGQRDSLVLNCGNCASVWRPIKDGFTKLSAAHLPEKGEDLIYLPFWRIKGDVSGVALNSYADVIRLANLPKAIQAGMEKSQFHFWAPAFKVRPKNLLNLSRTITLSQPNDKLSPGNPSARLHPVTLPLKEGLESLKLTMASFIKPKTRVAELLPEIRIKPRSFILVYLPFHENHHDLVQPRFSLSINKNMLAHVRHI